MSINEIFGSMVFNEKVMKERLPEEIYIALIRTKEEGKRLDISLASPIAEAMKEWAIEKGVTHFTHWFQPMTGITAEKHESFIKPSGDGSVIMEFSGKSLIMGESDASSFPSGGLRATFEARGYTAWDPTSYAFIKENTLYIPTAFYSYGGEALDKKTPLMRSMEFLSKQCIRILKLFGQDDIKKVTAVVGAEQEYFLIDKQKYKKRKDLVYTGRTLFGVMPPKGQELDDHYYGSIRPRVKDFMRDLDEELWKLGVYAKTEHNEVAPSQHELAPVYCSANLATDQNQLIMETMKKVADKHNFACLLHEKPFERINGSGKHNNWSLSTNTGENLFEPGKLPAQNIRFLLFMTAVIKAVDEYYDILRASTASASNDRRLGGTEAPPTIMSVYVGKELEEIIDSIISDKEFFSNNPVEMKTGVHVLPKLPKDTTDRNRTSPMVFTGNKFEFRMLGSSASLADPNIVINTIVAQELKLFADELEGSSSDLNDAIHSLIKRELSAHKRILFSGNSYSKEWAEEAEKRGLKDLKTTDIALKSYIDEKNIKLFTENNIFTEVELRSRYEILLETYYKIINIEANTMVAIANHDILPAAFKFRSSLASLISSGKAFKFDNDIYEEFSKISEDVYNDANTLKRIVCESKNENGNQDMATYFRSKVIPAMEKLRTSVDKLDARMPREFRPYPSYGDLLFDF